MRSVHKLIVLASSFVGLAHPGAGEAQWVTNGRALCSATGDQNTPVAVTDGAGGAIVAWTDHRNGSATSRVFVQRVLSGGAVDPAWPVDGLAVSNVAADQIDPAIALDGAGGAIVVWTDHRGGSDDIYAQHVLASGTIDGAWPAGGRALCAAALDQQRSAIVEDGAGGAIAAWIDYRNASDSDIFGQHVLASGAVDGQWPVNGLRICGAAFDQRQPKMTGDGAGGAVVTWTDVRSGGFDDIYAQRVLASGVVDPGWPVNGVAISTALNNQNTPSIASDAFGGAIIVWHDFRNGVDYDVFAQHVVSAGIVDSLWPVDGRALTTAVGHQTWPVLVTDGASGAIVAWQDSRSGNQDVFAQHVLADGTIDPAWLGNGRALCTVADDQFGPTIVTDLAGGAIVAWQDHRSGAYYEVFAQHVRGSGALDATWPVNGRVFSNTGYDRLNPAIVADGSGGAVVAWQDHRSGAADIYALRVYSCGELASAAQCTVDGVPVSSADRNQQAPVVTSDGASGAIVAWQDSRNGNLDIYVHHLLSSGSPDAGWPVDGRALCAAAGQQKNPVIVADGGGGAIVAWQDGRGAVQGIYAAHVLASGAADPAWPIDGRALATGSGDQEFPTIASDGAGGAIVAWQDKRSVGTTGIDIYAQRVRSSGVLDWSVSGVALCVASGSQELPAMVAAASGAIVAWEDARSGSYDVYAQHVLSSGTVDGAWPADGRGLCTAAFDQRSTSIVADGASGAVVAWQDRRDGNADIYAQHVLASGAVDGAWPLDGRALCAAAFEQQNPNLVGDGAGGAIATWEDQRDLNSDVYAQHVQASGALDAAWPVNGRALCTAANLQQNPVIAVDGSGGAFVSWQDYRGGSSADIYAQHVLSTGSVDPGWTVDGRILCGAINSQELPAIVLDGSGGALVAWQDFRGGNYYDLYAQHVVAGAPSGVPSEPRLSTFRMLSPYPNPARDRLTIHFDLPAAERVIAQVIDVTGHRVRSLTTGRELASGRQALVWNARDDSGAPLPPGIYFVRVRAGGQTDTKRIALLK